ncbi:uncharacterized protein LOC121861022 [Homarus americanus]|uniref:uncharacterized protein LOC121861022 n=1 Tax=Homarus americanus TaxID=6706 RepID=UPI001C450971|nr:uncharacterized protein LOC121861022 [Homarus americanus]
MAALRVSTWYSSSVACTVHSLGMTGAAQCPCSHTQLHPDWEVSTHRRPLSISRFKTSHKTLGGYVIPKENSTTPWACDATPKSHGASSLHNYTTPENRGVTPRDDRTTRQPPLLLFLLLLLTRPLVIAAAQERLITCECSKAECKEDGYTCTATGCYLQLLDRRDGSQPITSGCLTEKGASLLCMNQPPAVRFVPWPYLVCCNTNFCNRDVALTNDLVTRSDEVDSLRRLGVSSIEEFREKYDKDTLESDSDDLNTVYLAVIGAAVVLMIAISAAGFCVLAKYRSKHSRPPHVSLDNGMEKLKSSPVEPSAPPLLHA